MPRLEFQFTTILMLTTSLAAIPAHAGIAELLLKKGVITTEEYQQLKNESAAAAAPTPAPAPALPAPPTPAIAFTKGVGITSVDGSFNAQFGTLMQFDVARYNNAEDVDHNSGSAMRRGRLYMQGNVLKDWQYKLEMEFFGTSGTEVTDAYLRYNGFVPFVTAKPLAITAGHFKIPFSFEQLMADKDLSLMERSLPNALLKSRAPGVMVSTSGSHWTAAAMGFGEQLYSNTTNQTDEGGGASARVTWAPIIDDGALLHVGVSAQYLWPTQRAAGETTSFSTRPESFITSTRLINTGTINGDVATTQLLGAEFAGTLGSVALSGEYIRADISRDNGDDLRFSGWYAQAAWMLTGERRAYDADKGIYKGIVPARPVGTGGTGAWELSARYSALDLNDQTISGGRERNTTLGLGWYANNYVRISGNWVHVSDIEGGAFDGETLDALQARLQFAY